MKRIIATVLSLFATVTMAADLAPFYVPANYDVPRTYDELRVLFRETLSGEKYARGRAGFALDYLREMKLTPYKELPYWPRDNEILYINAPKVAEAIDVIDKYVDGKLSNTFIRNAHLKEALSGLYGKAWGRVCDRDGGGCYAWEINKKVIHVRDYPPQIVRSVIESVLYERNGDYAVEASLEARGLNVVASLDREVDDVTLRRLQFWFPRTGPAVVKPAKVEPKSSKVIDMPFTDPVLLKMIEDSKRKDEQLKEQQVKALEEISVPQKPDSFLQGLQEYAKSEEAKEDFRKRTQEVCKSYALLKTPEHLLPAKCK